MVTSPIMPVRILLLSEMEAFMIMEYVGSEEVSRKLVRRWLRGYTCTY